MKQLTTTYIDLPQSAYSIEPMSTFSQQLSRLALIVLAAMLTLLSQHYAVIRVGSFIVLTILTVTLGVAALSLADRLIVSQMRPIYV